MIAIVPLFKDSIKHLYSKPQEEETLINIVDSITVAGRMHDFYSLVESYSLPEAEPD